MVKFLLSTLVLAAGVSVALSADCLSRLNVRCLRKSEVGGFSAYMEDGDPCFTFSGSKYCFVTRGTLHPCECTAECGCENETVEPLPPCDDSTVPQTFPTNCDIGDDNTLCKYTGMGETCNNKVCAYAMTAELKKMVVDRHNELRRKVAFGNAPGQPPAANMEELVWDDELAASAQRWTDQCQVGHDENRNTPNYSQVGQNFAMDGFKPNRREIDVKKHVDLWYAEVKDMTPEIVKSFPRSNPAVIGHYTQVVWAKTKKVGCGMVKFESASGFFRVHVNCNYYPGGNFIGQEVYQEGPAGSKCANGQNNGLCI